MESIVIERLVRVGTVWGAVRYWHPYLAYRDVDWDDALVRALPAIETALNEEEFVAAVQRMLDWLGDPATTVVSASADSSEGEVRSAVASSPEPFSLWPEGDILSVRLNDLPSLQHWMEHAGDEALQREIVRAKGLIFDLRSAAPGLGPWMVSYFARIQHCLPYRDVTLPARRYVVHSGYKPQAGFDCGFYYSALLTQCAEVVRGVPDLKPRRIVFLVNEFSALPPIALAMQQAGDAFIVAQGELDESCIVEHAPVALSASAAAMIRVTEWVGPNGPCAVWADASVPLHADEAGADPNDAAFQIARELLSGLGPTEPKPRIQDYRAHPVWRPDKRYEEMRFPGREYRLLALFRFWNIIHYFYPYKELLDSDWATVLPGFIEKFAGASSALEYQLAIAELAAHVADDHTLVSGAELDAFLGVASPPITVRMIEGLPVVTDLLEGAGCGLQIGDVVLTVDGEAIGERMRRFGKYVAASTSRSHAAGLIEQILRGPEDSLVNLTVRRENHSTAEIRLPRKREYRWATRKSRLEVYQRLDSTDFGYVDLTRLTPDQVDAMFEALKSTTAIVFDLRGYPKGTAWQIAPRLNIKEAPIGAEFRRNLVSPGDACQGSIAFRQPIPTSDQWKYSGKIVTLIDERAISQAEHSGLFFEAVCNTTFIGSHTCGANGDITSFYLPGDVRVIFGGHDVRHADGRQLQRIGLVPHIEVEPTIAGIQSGRDEVLERAIEFLRHGSR